MVSHSPGEVFVDLHDDGPRRVQGLEGIVHRGAQAAVSILVRRGDLGHENVAADALFPDELRDLVEKYRGEVTVSLRNGSTHVGADKKGVCPQVPLELGSGVFAAPQAEHVSYLHIVVLLGVRNHGVHQRFRLGNAVPQYHCVPFPDFTHCLLCAPQLAQILFFPIVGHFCFLPSIMRFQYQRHSNQAYSLSRTRKLTFLYSA